MLVAVDEFSRERPAIRVERRLGSDEALEAPAGLFVARGAPEHVRSDDGPEFAAAAARAWLARLGVGALFVEPGSPRGDGCRESLDGKLRDGPLDREVLRPPREAQAPIEARRRHCDTARPRSALGRRPPAPGAAPEPAWAPAWAPPSPAPGQAGDVAHH